MTKSIQFRRGSTTEHALFTGLEGEITVDTTKKTAIVHDNTTAGGIPLAREDLSNIPMQKIVDKGIAKSNMENVSCNDIANKGIAKQDLSNVSKETIGSKGIMYNDCSNASQLASETTIGPTEFANETEACDEELSTKALSPKNTINLIKKYMTLPKGYINGFKITKVSDSSIQIDTGIARSDDDKYNIKLNDTIIKNINSYWEEGSNVGGIEENTTIIANKKYYVFVIAKEDKTTDIIITDDELDLPNSAAGNLDFITYRKIGSFKTDNNMYINEISITDTSNEGYLDTTEILVTNFVSTNTFTVAFDGHLFISMGLKNGAETQIKLNNTPMGYGKNEGSSWIFSTMSIKVKKGDIITGTGNNTANRNCALYLIPDRRIENV
ncbi:hypothetical protein HDR59_02420 [bacterium]|nr:hypothetical protein [bacterium]